MLVSSARLPLMHAFLVDLRKCILSVHVLRIHDLQLDGSHTSPLTGIPLPRGTCEGRPWK